MSEPDVASWLLICVQFLVQSKQAAHDGRSVAPLIATMFIGSRRVTVSGACVRCVCATGQPGRSDDLCAAPLSNDVASHSTWFVHRRILPANEWTATVADPLRRIWNITKSHVPHLWQLHGNLVSKES